MNTTDDPKVKSAEVPKPEPSFYERAEGKWNSMRGNRLGGKGKIFVFAVGAIFLGVIWMTYVTRPSGKVQRPQGEINHETLTREEIERQLTQAYAMRDDAPKPIRQPAQSKLKRNYATDIAVFVYQKEKLDSQSQVRDSQKNESLGLPSGTRIPATLSNRIFSFNIAAPVIVVLDRDFKWKNQVLLPKGTKFLGEASVVKSIDRINVNFDSLIFPDGRQLKVRAMALSPDGSGGIKGKVEKNRDIRVLKAIGEVALSGASLFVGGLSSQPYSLEDQLRMNLTQNLAGQASQDLRSVRVEQSITVEASTPVDVMILESI